jgi:predicted 3-demethylubiquinone-9 3-methyltransferase (glyoxalase superfamily)
MVLHLPLNENYGRSAFYKLAVLYNTRPFERYTMSVTNQPQSKERAMQKITTYLWFNDNAEDAINFYTSIFKNSKILSTSRLPAENGSSGKLMSATFQLEGQEYIALNGGPQFQFNESISLFVLCQNQAEVDDLWGKLTADGGEEGNCGWLKDKFGLSWQIVPTALGELMGDPNPVKAQNVMQAMLKMNKIDVAKLQEAYESV